jgi:hypothetical protein
LIGDWNLTEALVAELLAGDLPDSVKISLGINSVYVPAARGDFSTALARLEEVQPLIQASSDSSWLANFLGARSFVALARGSNEEAYVDALSASDADPRFTADAALPAVLLSRRAQMGAVLERIDQARVHNRLTDCSRRMLLAGLAALDGSAEQAVALFGGAIEGWRELGNIVQLSLCELAFVSLIGAQDSDARAGADEAREIFSRLDAEAFLARLNAAERARQPV